MAVSDDWRESSPPLLCAPDDLRCSLSSVGFDCGGDADAAVPRVCVRYHHRSVGVVNTMRVLSETHVWWHALTSVSDVITHGYGTGHGTTCVVVGSMAGVVYVTWSAEHTHTHTHTTC